MSGWLAARRRTSLKHRARDELLNAIFCVAPDIECPELPPTVSGQLIGALLAAGLPALDMRRAEIEDQAAHDPEEDRHVDGAIEHAIDLARLAIRRRQRHDEPKYHDAEWQGRRTAGQIDER